MADLQAQLTAARALIRVATDEGIVPEWYDPAAERFMSALLDVAEVMAAKHGPTVKTVNIRGILHTLDCKCGRIKPPCEQRLALAALSAALPEPEP